MKRFAYILFLVIAAWGCKKPYNPPAVTGNGSYLVVAGVVNAGSDSTTITLSRTVNVSSANTSNPVLGAIVAVVSDQNTTFPLKETTNGNYVTAGLNLDAAHQYRLSIKTNNELYQSDLAPVTITPPIDSIGFNIVKDPVTGIQIYANAHDATNNAKYFRWDYTEEWVFHPKYISYYVSNGSTLVLRDAAQDVSSCFTGDASSTTVLGSTAKLSQDVLYQSPIIFIASTSEKLESEYSILLHQYALTADAYNFWVNLKTNTEELGSIFDAQPSQLQGNIHCISNPSEPVIGYVSVCTVSSKRVFISNAILPAWVATYPYACPQPYCGSLGCMDTVNNGSALFRELLIEQSNANTDDGPPPHLGDLLPGYFFYVPRICSDCTVRGTVTPPSYWPK